MKITLIIPVYNEEETILKLLEEIKLETLVILSLKYPLVNLNILLVDDYSMDNTTKIIDQWCRNNSQFSYIRTQKNMGQGMAIYSGILTTDSPWIATIDADGENNPNYIINAIKILQNTPSCGLIKGVRKNRTHFMLNVMASKIGNGIINFYFNLYNKYNLKVQDIGCGIKLFKREIGLEMHNLPNSHRYLHVIATHLGYTIKEFPVKDRKRFGGKSKYKLSLKIIRFFREIFQVVKYLSH